LTKAEFFSLIPLSLIFIQFPDIISFQYSMNHLEVIRPFQKKIFINLLFFSFLLILLFASLVFILNKNFGLNILIIYAIFGVMVILACFILSRSFSKPITLLKRELEEVSKIHFNKTLDIHSDDEINSIVKYINNMLHMLQEREIDFKIVTNQRDKDRERVTSERNNLSVILSEITDGVIVVDDYRNIVLCNKPVEELTGLSLSSAIGRHIDNVLIFFDNNKSITSNFYLGRSEKITWFREKGLSIKNHRGEKLTVSLVTSPITLIDHSIGWIITFHDITEEIEAKEFQINFVSMAAHELRTPLNSIHGYATILKMEHEDELSEKGKELLESLSLSSVILEHLLENLINMTRIEQNIFTINTKEIDLTKTISDAVNIMKGQVKIKNQILDLQIKGPLPIVRADAFRITQVIINLVTNAIQYSHEGGIITVVADGKDNFLQVSVTDTGVGIPEDRVPKLFMKSFKTSENVSDGGKGTGLGLFISKSIIELQYGKIWVTSKEGKGTTITFTLPKIDLNNPQI
jgi:PAS domain S-box-containing protein